MQWIEYSRDWICRCRCPILIELFDLKAIVSIFGCCWLTNMSYDLHASDSYFEDLKGVSNVRE
jgi:hypothetical protein